MNDTNGAGAPPPPPFPPQQPSASGRSLVLRVSRRILWIGTVAFPLHNITMVEAFRLRTDWGAALLRALKGLLGAVVLYVVINVVSGGEASTGENGNPALIVVLIIAVLFVAFKPLFEPAKPVLVVQVASGSTVTVTLPNMDELRQIADRIAYAIDNPEAEFTAVVHQYNTNNYGPVANLNGGQGNTGFKL
ncbi:DUF6232 family protein [Streptomyces sp. NPDC049590]|uniref:DUF6232 family protein n=1 Tax=Streptomyces sp. NPDC049590 TaxID=3154834 RepID=UPI00343802D6